MIYMYAHACSQANENTYCVVNFIDTVKMCDHAYLHDSLLICIDGDLRVVSPSGCVHIPQRMKDLAQVSCIHYVATYTHVHCSQ